MKIQSILLFLGCFLLSGFTMPAIACPPPDCGSCCHWEGPVPGGSCQLNTGADCGDCSSCSGECESCNGCLCEDDNSKCTGECHDGCSNGNCVDDNSKCTGECHDGCSNGNCVDDNSKCTGECHDGCSDGDCVDNDSQCSICQECDDGDCVLKSTSDCDVDSDCPGECHDCFQCECVDDNTKCDYFDGCEICNGGECEDKCPALGKHCLTELGLCVECRDVLDCELCEECDDIMHTCEHPCDDCDPPKYCGYACVCVECYYGAEDTTTCSTANNTTECDCSENIINPCSSEEETIIYSGNSIKSCTGPDCDTVDVLCYTTYSSCKSQGSLQPLQWCAANDVGPSPPAPWPHSCQLNLDIPGPGCYTCVNSFESGLQTYESQGDCPIEDWP